MEEPTFDLKGAIQSVQRWIGWLALGLLVGAGLSFLVTTRIDPVYQAVTKVLVTRTGQVQSSDFTAYLSDLQLTQTYLQLLTTETILDITSERTGVKIDPEDDVVKAQVVRETQVIQIEVQHPDPQKAAFIANTMVEVLIEQNALIQAGHYDAMEKSLQEQKTQIEAEMLRIEGEIQQTSTESLDRQKVWFEGQITSLQEEVASLEQQILELEAAGSPQDRLVLGQKNARLAQLQSLLALYQENYNSLLLIYANPAQNVTDTTDSQLARLVRSQILYQQFYDSILAEFENLRLARVQHAPNLVHIEKAFPPEEPIGPRRLLNTILGGMAGFMLVAVFAFLRETLDDTLRTPLSIQQLLGVPVIGFIPFMPQYKMKVGKPYATYQSPSPVSEAFRSLRANLDFVSSREHIRSLLVAGPGGDDGKSTVALHLAAALSIAGKRVVLVDADLHNPRIHQFLGLPNQDGLSDLVDNPALMDSIGYTGPELPNLRVITSGELPTAPAELLSSREMDQVLSELYRLADMVVIDAPRSLFADAQILAGKVDAVLFVMWPGRITAERARGTLELFRLAGARVVGVVLNGIRRNSGFYYPAADWKERISRRKMRVEAGDADETGETSSDPPYEDLILDRSTKIYAQQPELLSPEPGTRIDENVP